MTKNKYKEILMNKKIIFTTAFLISVSLMAAPSKPVEIKREEAKKVMANHTTKENKDYISGVSKSIAGIAKMSGLESNIERALHQGNVDLLVSITRLADKKDVKALATVVELSGGVRSETDAKLLAQITEKNLDTIPGAAEFLAAAKSEVEKTDSLEKALTNAAESFRKDKTISAKEWLEKLLECV